MDFLNKLLGFRDFSKLEEIKKYISKNFNLEKNEDTTKAKELIIFETTRQKTWLICTENKLFCVLDDIDKDSFEVRWHLTKANIVSENKIILDLKINPNYKQKTGMVDIGKNHKGWLYNKKLFPSEVTLKEKIENLISTKMLK